MLAADDQGWSGASPARTIRYLDGENWSTRNLVGSANGSAALTFCQVPFTEHP